MKSVFSKEEAEIRNQARVSWPGKIFRLIGCQAAKAISTHCVRLSVYLASSRFVPQISPSLTSGKSRGNVRIPLLPHQHLLLSVKGDQFALDFLENDSRNKQLAGLISLHISSFHIFLLIAKRIMKQALPLVFFHLTGLAEISTAGRRTPC